MHSFYVENIDGDTAELLPEESKHASKVLRLARGDEICAMDGRGRRWRAELLDGARVRLIEALADHEPPVALTVYQGLPKADKLDFIVQKLTELGAGKIVPVRMERCVTRLDDREGEKRAERLRRIAREAGKQCGRANPPEVTGPVSLANAVRAMAAHDLLIVPWETAQDTRMRDVRRDDPEARDIGIVIGPEGGMAPGEVQAMQAVGARVVTLGPRILRTETAAVTAAALAMSLWGDL